MDSLTVDQKSGVSVKVSDFHNEARTLDYLRFGLHTIALQIWDYEQTIRKREAQAGMTMTFFGDHPDVDARVLHILPCLFHWYGVSLCNYTRLAGFVTGLASKAIDIKLLESKAGGETVKDYCKDYVQSVLEISEVLIWRNKVGAHFAITDPHRTDNIATLEMSVMYPIGYANSNFRVNVMTLSKTDGGGTVQTSELPCWSVTEVHQKLIPRYWKDFQFPVAAG